MEAAKGEALLGKPPRATVELYQAQSMKEAQEPPL